MAKAAPIAAALLRHSKREQFRSNTLLKADPSRSSGTGLLSWQFTEDKDTMTSLGICSSV